MRLVLVWRGATDGYSWAPTLRADDVVVAYDDLAASDFAPQAIRFDDLRTWEDRDDDERRIVRAFEQFRDHPALSGLSLGGCRLTDFFEHSLKVDLGHVVRGWAAARCAGTGCTAVVADPVCPAALVIGAHAALGLEPPDVRYEPAHAPTWQSSVPRRIVGNSLVHIAASVPRSVDVRIAATANFKLTPAMAAVDAGDLRGLGMAAMPLPGFDPRENLRTAARARLPTLRTLAPITQRRAPRLSLSGDLAVSTGLPALDGAFSDVAARLADLAWPQMWQAVKATETLDRQQGLRALLMPTLFSGTPRVFTAWARRNGVRVGVLQHGLYAHRRFDGQDRGADMVLTWGDGVAEQTLDWGGQPPAPRTVGAPSLRQADVAAAPPRQVRRVLLITTGPHLESGIFPTAIHDTYLAAVLPGMKQLQQQGIDVNLRVAPSESPARYLRAFALAGTTIPVAERVPIGDAIKQHDLVVCPFSSVAIEAGALGMPVLMCLPLMPADFAREYLVKPWTESLPGVFHNAEEFLALAEGLVGEHPPTLATGLELAGALSQYAQPFDPGAFTSALGELGA